MKRTLAILAMLAIPVHADLVAQSHGNELRLFDSPCVHAGTLGRLNEQWRPKFKKAQGTIEGRVSFGCWIKVEEEGVYWILMEGGEGFPADPSRFRDEPGV